MTKLLLSLIVCGAALGAEVAAQAPRQLPVFALTRANGAETTSQSLVQPGPWVLVIAQQPCATCDATLAVLDAVTTPERAARVVLVLAGASAAELFGVSSRHPGLSPAAWFRDEARAALPALGVGGSPAVVGLNGDRILWTRNVAATSASDLESLINSWIR